jgi:hypothetical protein
LLLKVVISRAFNSVAWTILLELIQHIGFLTIWIDWMASLLVAANTRVMVNGNLSPKMWHARGLQQRDLLSLMLFLVVMEALNALIRKADDWSLFQQLQLNAIPHRASLYADDLIMFISPSPANMHRTKEIFSLFEGASCNTPCYKKP